MFEQKIVEIIANVSFLMTPARIVLERIINS